MGKASRRPLDFDRSVPNIARMYDYWLSGRQRDVARYYWSNEI